MLRLNLTDADENEFKGIRSYGSSDELVTDTVPYTFRLDEMHLLRATLPAWAQSLEKHLEQIVLQALHCGIQTPGPYGEYASIAVMDSMHSEKMALFGKQRESYHARVVLITILRLELIRLRCHNTPDVGS